MLDTGLDFSTGLGLLGLWHVQGLMDSLEASGIVSPLVASDSGSDGSSRNPLLLDGYKRLEWAKERDVPTVPVTIVPMAHGELLPFLIAKYGHLLKSCVAKALFIDFIVRTGFSEETVAQEAMGALGLQPHLGLLRKYRRICRLPRRILAFCHEKDLSLKKCLNLTYKPSDLLERIMDLQGRICLSATLLMELCDSVSEICTRYGLGVSEFFDSPEIGSVVESDMEPSRKTAALRATIRRFRFPTITRVNEELEDIERRYLARCPFKTAWDTTLENRLITITATLTDASELSELIQALSSKETRKGIQEILSRF